VFSRTTKREHEQEKKKREHDLKPKKQREQETLQEALSKPIDSSNKGYQILMRMGFEGKTLGKSCGEGSTSRGLKEPIPIVIKTDRKGIREKMIKSSEASGPQECVLLGRFQDKEKRNLDVRQTRSDVCLSRKACFNLDSLEGKGPEKEYFWPWHVMKALKEKEEEEIDEQEPTEEEYSQQLIEITKYLRETYFYCVWCGTRFENDNDLKESCPGDTKVSHD